MQSCASGSSDSTANNEDLRAELKQGLEDLIQDNHGSLQDLLNSDLLSDQQIVSVQYFSMTMVQTKTMVMQQAQVPTVDDVSRRLLTQFDALMDKLQATLDKLVPGAGNQAQETVPATTDTEALTADNQAAPSEEDVSTTPEPTTTATPDEVEPSATEQATQADTQEETQEETPKTTDARETKTLSLFSLTQSFSLTFKQSMAKFHSRMNHFHMHKGRHHNGVHQRSALVARFYQMQTETSVYQSTASGDDSSTLVA